MYHHWKRYPIRAKLCCCLLGFLLLTLSALLLLGSLFNRTMDLLDKRLQDYYNITAFSEAFTAADHALERILRGGTEPQRHLSDFEQARREADSYLIKLAEKNVDSEQEQYRLMNQISSGYHAYMKEADILLSLFSQTVSRDVLFRYFEISVGIREHLQTYIPELLAEEIHSGQKMYAENRAQLNAVFLGGIAIYAVLHIIAVFALLYMISRTFLEPVQEIAGAMQQIESGDFEIPDIPHRTEDELAQLVTVFNTMKRSTRDLVSTLREKNELERELHAQAEEAVEIRRQLELARYAQLKSQVNPHFLFNTLNTISRIAREEQSPVTEQLIISLARLFRYSLSADAPCVTLSREIKHVSDYMRIQDIRFGDRLHFSWRTDPLLDPNTVLTVPYTLQPFVENAVIHGLRDTESGGQLRITLKRCPEGLKIYITDNGRGMSREQLARLRSAAPPEDDSHIGIYNVRCRLLHFQPKSRLLLYSYPGRGTCVKIVIPQEEEEP